MNTRLANPATSPEYQQTTRASYILILAALATYVIVGLLSAYFHDWKTVWTSCGGGIFLSLPFVLLKRGHFRIGNVVLMLIVLVTVTIVATVGHGIHDISIVSYPIVLVYVGLTLDRVMLGIYGGLTFVAVLWLVFGAYFWLVCSCADLAKTPGPLLSHLYDSSLDSSRLGGGFAVVKYARESGAGAP